MKKFLTSIMVFLVTILSICGCVSATVDEVDSAELYSRKSVESMSSSATFGKEMGDDIYVALQHVYSSEELKENYGASFEITPENVICYSSEGNTRFFYMYEGNAEYGFIFEQEIYRVKVSKTYKGKWKVDSGTIEMNKK